MESNTLPVLTDSSSEGLVPDAPLHSAAEGTEELDRIYSTDSLEQFLATGWGARAPNPCVRITDPETEPVVEVIENAHAPFSQGNKGCLHYFREDKGDRDSPKGRTLYWYARPSNANRRNACGAEGSTHGSTGPSTAADRSWGWMHLKMRFCVSILKGSLWKAHFKMRRHKIGRNPPLFLGTMM